MKAQQSTETHGHARRVRWMFASAITGVVAAVVLSACGSSSSHATTAQGSATSASLSCSGTPGVHHARVVVETSPSSVLQRCVGFSSPTIPATTLLSDGHMSLGTQKYSFGLAICSVNGVPAHYSQCLPSGKPYWALFVSHGGAAWTNPSVGVSDISVAPGDSLGLRYDSPKGNPAPPPATTRA